MRGINVHTLSVQGPHQKSEKRSKNVILTFHIFHFLFRYFCVSVFFFFFVFLSSFFLFLLFFCCFCSVLLCFYIIYKSTSFCVCTVIFFTSSGYFHQTKIILQSLLIAVQYGLVIVWFFHKS